MFLMGSGFIFFSLNFEQPLAMRLVIFSLGVLVLLVCFWADERAFEKQDKSSRIPVVNLSKYKSLIFGVLMMSVGGVMVYLGFATDDLFIKFCIIAIGVLVVCKWLYVISMVFKNKEL